MAAGEALSIGDLLLGLSKYEVSVSQTALTSTSTEITGFCDNTAGSTHYNWTDNSGDGLRGVGDTVTIQLSNCTIPQTGSTLTGSVVITVQSKSASALGLAVDYGGGLLLVDLKDNTPSHVFGTKVVNWSDDGLTRQITITSSARDDLKLTSINQDEATGRVYSEQLKSIDLKHSLSRETARANTKYAYQLISEFLNDTFDISTPIDLSSYFDTFPDLGEMRVQSKSTEATTRLRARYSENGRQLSYDAYQKNEASPSDSGFAQWNAITSGVMWWGEALGKYDEFCPSCISDFAPNKFEQLKAMPIPGSNAQIPVWSMQLSAPIDVNHVPTLRIHRENSDYGDPYFWGPEVIQATTVAKGAYVTITPTQPLQHGLTYYVEAVDATGSPTPIYLQDASGNIAGAWQSRLTIDDSLIANISLAADAPILLAGKAIRLDSASSQSAHGLLSYQWTQVSGPPIVFASPNQASTVISLAGAPGSDTTATVQLQITDLRGQVEYSRKVIPIVADQSNSVVMYFRSQTGDSMGGGKQVVSVSQSSQANFYKGYPPSYIYFMGGNWNLILYNGNAQPIQVGSYENAQLAPFSDTSNGLNFSYQSHGCNRVSGRFNVLEVAYDAEGQVTKLAVDFDQYCDNSTAGLFGSFRFHSAIPVRP